MSSASSARRVPPVNVGIRTIWKAVPAGADTVNPAVLCAAPRRPAVGGEFVMAVSDYGARSSWWITVG